MAGGAAGEDGRAGRRPPGVRALAAAAGPDAGRGGEHGGAGRNKRQCGRPRDGGKRPRRGRRRRTARPRPASCSSSAAADGVWGARGWSGGGGGGPGAVGRWPATYSLSEEEGFRRRATGAEGTGERSVKNHGSWFPLVDLGSYPMFSGIQQIWVCCWSCFLTKIHILTVFCILFEYGYAVGDALNKINLTHVEFRVTPNQFSLTNPRY